MAADGTANATTAFVAAVAGLAGVFLAGWMARSRERWRWRTDNRRDAYVQLLRAVTRVHDSFDGLVQADRGGRPVDELAARAATAQGAARRLDAARAGVRIVGSRAMRDYVDNEDMSSFFVEARYSSVKGLTQMWDEVEDGVGAGWVSSAIDWADDIERIAVGELNPDRLRARLRWPRSWARWRDRRLRDGEQPLDDGGRSPTRDEEATGA